MLPAARPGGMLRAGLRFRGLSTTLTSRIQRVQESFFQPVSRRCRVMGLFPSLSGGTPPHTITTAPGGSSL
jgi:hypothetical protein